MSSFARLSPVTETVTRCTPTQDGNWIVHTHTGKAPSSPVEIPEGARVQIIDGKAVRA